MNKTGEAEIHNLEQQLKVAMLNSDISALDELLASDLIFTNHLGQIMTKQDDLNAHKSGVVKIDQIELIDQNIKMLNDVAVVTVQASILGSFNGYSSQSEFRFTRVWCKSSDHKWLVTVAHSSMVT